VVHERWQRAAAAAGALAGLVVAAWLLSTPDRGARPLERPGTTAAPPAVDWCAAGEGIAAAVDGVVLAPSWPPPDGGADAVAELAASWGTLLATGAAERAWGSAQSMPSPGERALAVRQLQVVRDALAEAVASGRAGAVRVEARALDDLLQRWC
jgi:hypothetical protein